MNILMQKIEEVPGISTYFKKVAKGYYWKYVFDIVLYLDRLQEFRGIGKKTSSDLKFFFKNNFDSIEEVEKKLSKVISDISNLPINAFPEIINSKEFKVLDDFFLDLHKRGFSNRRILDSLKHEDLKVLYFPSNIGMNTQVFLTTFEKASKKDKNKLLSLLGKNEKLFVQAYQDKILEALKFEALVD